MSAQVFDIKQKRHCCYIYQSETRMPILLGNSLSRTPLIYQYSAVSQPLPASGLAQSKRPCQANSFFLFSLPLKNTQQIIFGPAFPELSRTESKLLSTAVLSATWRESKHYWKHTHTVAFCVKTGLHVSLSPFPARSRRHDSPAGATSVRWDLLMPRQPPCKARAWLP